MPKAVICLAKTQTEAQATVSRLEQAGIASADISIVFADHSGRYGHAANSPALLGLLTGMGKIVIPGAGFYIAAGPILTAIRDTPKSTLEGVHGALMSFGLSEYEASRLQDQVKSGAILMTFHTPDNDEAQRIREILDNTEVEDICVVGEEDLTDSHHSLRSLNS